MSKRVSNLFKGKIAGGWLVLACLLTVAAFFAVPSSASAAATGKIATVYWKNGTSSGYELQATVTTPDVAQKVTISGTGIAAGTELYATVDGDGLEYSGTVSLAAAPDVVTQYTITINYGTTTETLTALKASAVLGSANLPTPTNPLGALSSSDSFTFHWTGPATPPTGFAKYSVSVSDADSLLWSQEVLSTTQTSTLYEGPVLVAGAHTWAVAAVDSNGNRAENRTGSFVYGANFKGKVTDINGNGLGNIRVQAATPSGTDVGPSVTTNADGTYIYAGLAPGEYKVHFADWAYYWENRLEAATANVLPVTANSVISGVNATIGGWGALTGSVYVTGSYKPAEVQVTLLDANKVAVPSVQPLRVPLTASGFGEFYMALIRPGSYHMRFSAPGYADVVTTTAFTIVQNQTLQGASAVWAMLNTPLPATLTVQRSGSGTVTSTPVGISCASGFTTGCSFSFPGGTAVTLHATPDQGFVLGAWGGACTGTGSCVVTMNTAQNVTATFTAKPATVKVSDSAKVYYAIGKALDDLNEAVPKTVSARGIDFVENVIMVSPATIKLIGGYTNDAFTIRSTSSTVSRTAIDGSLRIRNGKLMPDRLVIK